MRRLNKKGTTEWTIGKLITLLLLVVLVVLVIVGVSFGFFKPAQAQTSGFFDNVLSNLKSLFGLGGGAEECYVKNNIIIYEDKSKEGGVSIMGKKLDLCKTYCQVELDKGGVYKYNLDSGKLEYWNGKDWGKVDEVDEAAITSQKLWKRNLRDLLYHARRAGESFIELDGKKVDLVSIKITYNGKEVSILRASTGYGDYGLDNEDRLYYSNQEGKWKKFDKYDGEDWYLYFNIYESEASQKKWEEALWKGNLKDGLWNVCK